MPNVSQSVALSTPIALPDLPQLPTLNSPQIGGPVFTDPNTNINPNPGGIFSNTNPITLPSQPSSTSGPSGLQTDSGNTASTSGLGSAIGSLASKAASIFGSPAAQIGAFLLGLILIAGALYLFKPVQNVVNSTIKRGAKVAAIAA
jgi:hypothetical protein